MQLAEIIVRLDLEARSIERTRRTMEARDTHQTTQRLQYRSLGRQLDTTRQQALAHRDKLAETTPTPTATAQLQAARRELDSEYGR